MSDPWSTEIQTVPPPRKGLSPGGIAALACALLVLAVGGAAIGWKFADGDLADGPIVAGTPSPSPTTVTSTPTPSSTPSLPSDSPSPVPSPVPSPGAVAGLVVGMDFRQARAKLDELGMQAVLKFDGTSDGTLKVLSVSPDDAKIASGVTVTLQVSGASPEIDAKELADIIGLPCQDAKSKLVKAGLLIDSYTDGIQTGMLQSVNPALVGLAFNTRVVLTCVVESSSAPVSAP